MIKDAGTTKTVIPANYNSLYLVFAGMTMINIHDYMVYCIHSHASFLCLNIS